MDAAPNPHGEESAPTSHPVVLITPMPGGQGPAFAFGPCCPAVVVPFLDEDACMGGVPSWGARSAREPWLWLCKTCCPDEAKEDSRVKGETGAPRVCGQGSSRAVCPSSVLLDVTLA